MRKTALSVAVLAALVTSASVASADEPVSTTTTNQASGGGSASFSASTSGAGAGASASSSTPGSDGDATKEVLPWVVGGIGAASLITGIVLHVAAPDLPQNCVEGTRTCTRKANQSDASFNEDQEQAGEAQLMPNLGNIAIAGGAVLLVAGVSMYFWYHQDSPGKSAKNKPSTKPIFTPYAGPTGGGFAGLIRF
jgi:opacity protein-like surface antigen